MKETLKNIRWHKGYKINAPAIDAQHQQLFNTYADLNIALKNGLRPKHIDDTLERLQQYSTRHFTLEERHMRELDYPGLAEQIAAHRKFSATLEEIATRFHNEGFSPAIVQQVRFELGQWLHEHVSGLDMEFGKYLNSVQRKKN